MKISLHCITIFLLLAAFPAIVIADEDEAASTVAVEDTKAAVTVAKAREGTLPLEVYSLATVISAPGSPSRIIAASSGRLMKISAVEGDHVSSATILMELDPRPFDAAREKAKAALDRATGELHAGERGGVDAAQDELTAGASKLASAAQAARRDATRVAALRAQGMASDRAVADAEAAATAAEDDARLARSRASRFGASDRSVELSKLKSAESEARADVVLAQVDSEGARIAAPAEGVIGKILVSPGDRIESGQPVAEFVSASPPLLALMLSASSAQRLGKDLPVHGLQPEGEISGTVQSIASSVDADTGLVRALVSVKPGERKLLVGELLPVAVEVEQSARGIIVPASALSFNDEDPVVAIVQAEHAKVISVKILARSGDEVCLEGEGLTADSVVITEGNDNIPDGAGIVVEDAAHD
ncbi:efflux RND transporter periplasmic adaptor subunit [soil metagenome]